VRKVFFRHFNVVLFLLSAIAARQAHAGGTPFGGEITFTSDAMIAAQTAGNVVNNPVSERARDDMAWLMRERCARAVPKCRVIEGKSKYGIRNYRVAYADNGWWYQIETDPSVVEIQTKPATAQELEQMESRIQRDIFDLATEMGLRPDAVLGGGHIHIGMHGALEGDARLFRNFFVDYVNHSELGTGILSFLGNANAPTLGELSIEQRHQFVTIIRDFDAGHINSEQEFAARIQQEVYYANPRNWLPPEKYQALNVMRMIDPSVSEEERTFELRAFPGQQSARDFILEAKLLTARLKLMKGFRGFVPYDPAPIDALPAVKAARFYRYVTDSGLSWHDYSRFVAKEFRDTAPKMGCDLRLLAGAL
jgi:hypothetical protein